MFNALVQTWVGVSAGDSGSKNCLGLDPMGGGTSTRFWYGTSHTWMLPVTVPLQEGKNANGSYKGNKGITMA